MGDGNCFYRAFGVSYCEHLIRNEDPECLKTFIEYIRNAKSDSIYKFIYEDFSSVYDMQGFLWALDNVYSKQ